MVCYSRGHFNPPYSLAYTWLLYISNEEANDILYNNLPVSEDQTSWPTLISAIIFSASAVVAITIFVLDPYSSQPRYSFMYMLCQKMICILCRHNHNCDSLRMHNLIASVCMGQLASYTLCHAYIYCMHAQLNSAASMADGLACFSHQIALHSIGILICKCI